MDDERCDCLFSRSKPQFLGAVNVDPGMHSHAGAWERGNRPAVVCVCIPTRKRGNEEKKPRLAGL